MQTICQYESPTVYTKGNVQEGGFERSFKEKAVAKSGRSSSVQDPRRVPVGWGF